MFYFPQIKYLNLYFFNIEVFRLVAYLAAIIGAIIILREAKKRKLDKTHTWFLIIASVVGVVIGARLFYYFGPWTWNRDWSFLTRLFKFTNIFGSGLVFYGGLIGMFFAVLIYCKLRKINFWRYGDAIAMAGPIIQIIGRLGCFIANDGCRGIETTVPWAIVRFSGSDMTTGALHPARLYEIIGLIVLFFVMKKLDKKKMFDGFLVLIFLMGYALIRFVVEFFRAYHWHLFGLTASQIVSLVVFGVCLVVFLKKSREKSVS